MRFLVFPFCSVVSSLRVLRLPKEFEGRVGEEGGGDGVRRDRDGDGVRGEGEDGDGDGVRGDGDGDRISKSRSVDILKGERTTESGY